MCNKIYFRIQRERNDQRETFSKYPVNVTFDQ